MKISLLRVCLFCLSLCKVLAAEPGKAEPLFDGQTLSGWKTASSSDAMLWSVIDGVIVGGDGENKVQKNSYLHTVKEFQNFEFRCLFRLSGDPSTGLINSGIQYRSTVKDGHMIGYQADIGNGYWGDIYDELRRRKALVKGDLKVLDKILDPFGWNSYIIRCHGARHELYINGVKVADWEESDYSISQVGVIGIQLHSGGNAKIEVSDVSITEL